jgi:uncharacterized membrane protein YphA (DoxX/SURF4 family)
MLPPASDLHFSGLHDKSTAGVNAQRRDFRYRRWVNLTARWTLAGLFLWAGIRKAMEPELFLQDIESYELLPYRWAWLASIWLPFLEITAAAALLTTWRWAQAGALIIGGMLLVFLAAIISAWARGLSLSCGCFGSSTEPANYPWSVVRDLLMLGLVAAILWSSNDAKGLEDTKPGSTTDSIGNLNGEIPNSTP